MNDTAGIDKLVHLTAHQSSTSELTTEDAIALRFAEKLSDCSAMSTSGANGSIGPASDGKKTQPCLPSTWRVIYVGIWPSGRT